MGRLFIALLLALIATPATAAWHEARTEHFIIFSEQKPDELRRYAERFDAAVRTVRKMTDPLLTDGGKLSIYVLPTVRAVEKLMRPGVAGFYIGRAGGSIAVVSRETIGFGVGKIDLSRSSSTNICIT